jgi:Mrp family chromosome partitioning ATPase
VLGGNGLTLPPIDELRSRLAELLEHFDYVLIDAPGAGGSGDAAALGQAAGAAILVVEANRTRRLTARKAKETLESAGVELIGTVLHNRLFPIPEGIYKRL